MDSTFVKILSKLFKETGYITSSLEGKATPDVEAAEDKKEVDVNSFIIFPSSWT